MVKGLEDVRSWSILGIILQCALQLPYFNNFALDPHRIQPLVHPPVNTGNSSQAPPQAYGLQPPVYFGEYGRNSLGDAYPLLHYNPNNPGNNWGPHPTYGPPGSYPPPPRRDDAGRRLSDRISGFASSEPSVIPATAGLPPKPTPAALDAALSSGNGNRRSKTGVQTGGPAPPPPPDAKEDPRAAAGKRVSYHDMDLVAEVKFRGLHWDLTDDLVTGRCGTDVLSSYNHIYHFFSSRLRCFATTLFTPFAMKRIFAGTQQTFVCGCLTRSGSRLSTELAHHSAPNDHDCGKSRCRRISALDLVQLTDSCWHNTRLGSSPIPSRPSQGDS